MGNVIFVYKTESMSFIRSVVIIVLFVAVQGVFAQSYNTPESIEFYPADSSYFVSNAGTGEILKRSSNNELTLFISDLPAGPHGLELVGDTLYACTGSTVHAISAATGAIIQEIAVGGSFLNGITHKNNQLFITDFTAKKIYTYRIQENELNTFVSGLVKTPNGIVYDSINDRLVMVNWGADAPINAISLVDSTVSELTATDLNNCDGIAMDCDGNFYVASWSPQRISVFDNMFATEPLTADITGLSNAADIYYNALFDTLAIPSSGNDKVVMAYFESCIEVDTPVTISEIQSTTNMFYPNPAGDYFQLANAPEDINNIVLLNSLGQVVKSQYNDFHIIPLSNLLPGYYFVIITHSNNQYITGLIQKY